MKTRILTALILTAVCYVTGCGQAESTPEAVEAVEVSEAPEPVQETEEPEPTEAVEVMTEAETEAEAQEAGEVALTNTYRTRFGEVNGVGASRFAFDYPDGWTVTDEVVSDGTSSPLEMVVLTNDRGSRITYMDFTTLGGNGHVYQNIEAEAVGTSNFVPLVIDRDDDGEPDIVLGNMVVLRGKIVAEMESDIDEDMVAYDGGEFYAVTPDSAVGLHEWINGDGGIYEEFSFPYPIERIALIAEPADSTFTEAERQEVIAVLGSFREE